MHRLTVPLKSKLPPSREMRLVSHETRLERNKMSLDRNETSLVSRECTGSTNAAHVTLLVVTFDVRYYQFGSLRNFFNPIIFKLDKHVVLLPINYMASKNR